MGFWRASPLAGLRFHHTALGFARPCIINVKLVRRALLHACCCVCDNLRKRDRERGGREREKGKRKRERDEMRDVGSFGQFMFGPKIARSLDLYLEF